MRGVYLSYSRVLRLESLIQLRPTMLIECWNVKRFSISVDFDTTTRPTSVLIKITFLLFQVNFHSEDYCDVFKKEELIYLTSDSENVIDSLDSSKVYIIGALVDHNSQKVVLYIKIIIISIFILL